MVLAATLFLRAASSYRNGKSSSICTVLHSLCGGLAVPPAVISRWCCAHAWSLAPVTTTWYRGSPGCPTHLAP